MPTHADDALFLRLALTRGIGPATAHRLLKGFGDIGAIFQADRARLVATVGEAAAQALRDPPEPETERAIATTLVWLENDDHHLLTWAHPKFPAALLETGDAPLLLFAHGRLELLARPALAVVGSRNCSGGGADTAAAFADAFSAGGLCVVSGLAQGIDSAAHRGALLAAQRIGPLAGSTIAVIGTGIDRVYPARNRDLAHRVAEHGLLLSEYPLGTAPRPENFPRRNRIISGLSRGVLVVEASLASGSLITARLAGDQGRDVFAIPGSIHSTFHKGCHRLIKQGAKLVEAAADVFDELGLAPGAAAATVKRDDATESSRDGLLAHIEHAPIAVDEIVERAGNTIDQVLAELTLLELEGRVERLADGRWQRR